MSSFFFRIFHRFFYLFSFVSFLNKIQKIINCEYQKSMVYTKAKQVCVTTKNYLKKLNRTPVNPNPTEVITFLDRDRLAISQKYISGHSHIQDPTRNVQWTFMGGYLNYMYVFVCGNCLAKTYCFLPSIGQLTMPNFFSAKYMFAMVPTKEYRKKLKENFYIYTLN